MPEGNEQSEGGLGEKAAWNQLADEPNNQPATDEQPAEEIEAEEDVNLSGQAEGVDSPETPAGEQPAQQPPQIDDWDTATDEQKLAHIRYNLDKNPSEVLQGYLRQSDYTTKTTETAKETERLEQERSDLDRQTAAAQERQQTAPTPEVAASREEAEVAAFAAQFKAQTGRDPTQTDYTRYLVAQTVGERENIREAQAAETRFDDQFDQLAKQYPQVNEPGVREAIYKKLAGSNVASGEVKEAFLGKYGENLIQQASGARGQQATRSSQQPTTPPGAGGTEQPEPTSDLDEIADRQKKSGVISRLLGRIS